jgi:hypothetical protein
MCFYFCDILINIKMCSPPWEWMPPTLNMGFPCGNTYSHVWGNSMFTRLGTYGVFMGTNIMLFNMGTCVPMRRHIFPSMFLWWKCDSRVGTLDPNAFPIVTFVPHRHHALWKKGVLQLALQHIVRNFMLWVLSNKLHDCKSCNSPYIQCNSIAILLKQLIFNYYAIALQLQP